MAATTINENDDSNDIKRKSKVEKTTTKQIKLKQAKCSNEHGVIICVYLMHCRSDAWIWVQQQQENLQSYYRSIFNYPTYCFFFSTNHCSISLFQLDFSSEWMFEKKAYRSHALKRVHAVCHRRFSHPHRLSNTTEIYIHLQFGSSKLVKSTFAARL